MFQFEQIQAIRNVFLGVDSIPDDTRWHHPVGRYHVRNWEEITSSIRALSGMPWFNFSDNSYWQLFLDRHPASEPLYLSSAEAEEFRKLLQTLISENEGHLRLWDSMQPIYPVGAYTLAIMETRDPSSLAEASGHIKHVTDLAAIDDAFTIHSVRPGSIELCLCAGPLTTFGLVLAIRLARYLKGDYIIDKLNHFKKILNRSNFNVDIEEDTLVSALQEDEKERFWESNLDLLQRLHEGTSLAPNESKNKIEQSGREIAEKAEDLGVTWIPPVTVAIPSVHGNIIVSINHRDPELVSHTVRALTASSDSNDSLS